MQTTNACPPTWIKNEVKVSFSNRLSCVSWSLQTQRVVSTRGGSFTATATGISVADTPGRTPKRTAESTAAIWPASTAKPSRISSGVSAVGRFGKHRKCKWCCLFLPDCITSSLKSKHVQIFSFMRTYKPHMLMLVFHQHTVNNARMFQTHSEKAVVQISAGTFLCGFCILSLSMCAFTSPTTVQKHA